VWSHRNRGIIRWARRSSLVALACTAGCGRIGFEPLERVIDCWPSWRAGDPALTLAVAATVNTKGKIEKNPFLTADRTTLYFASDRPGGAGGLDIWRATRGSPGDPFGPAEPASEVSSTRNDNRFETTADGLTGVLSRANAEGLYELWLATRDADAAPFVVTRLPSPPNSAGNTKDPHLSADGRRLYYSVDSARFMFADRDGAGFSAFSPLQGFDGLPDLGDPNLSNDELIAVFSSSFALYVSTRESTAVPFGPRTPLTQINESGPVQDAFVTADGCELWFARKFTDDYEIYVAQVSP
jgi:hypothetical protein